MDDTETREFIVTELSKHRKRSDVIMAICEKTGAPWAEVQSFVYQVEFEQRKNITIRQSPLVIIFGVTFILGGGALIIFAIMFRQIQLIILGVSLVAGGIIGLWNKIQKIIE